MATKYRIVLLLFLLTLFSVGCNTSSRSTESAIYNASEFNELVEMHCRARILKNERFDLAEKMRKSQPINDVRNLDSLKSAKGAQSRALADSIAKVIEVLSGDMTPKEKRTFNDSIEAHILRMKCES